MNTKEELNVLIEEVETLNKKLTKLTEEEQEQVTGGFIFCVNGDCKTCPKTYCDRRKA